MSQQERCVFASVDGVASCQTHKVALGRDIERWWCVDGQQWFPFGAEFGSHGHPKPMSKPATPPSVQGLIEKLKPILASMRENTRQPDVRDGYTYSWKPEHWADEIETVLAAALASPPSLREWQPIETAPKDGTPVLMFAPDWDRPCVLAWRIRQGDGRWDDDSGDTFQDYQPTHWAPLPVFAALTPQEPDHA
jgi:hypothetical protein